MNRSVETFCPAGADTLTVIQHRRGAGPHVAITANLHGDEVAGVQAVHQLDRLLASTLVRGECALYPTLNPGGLFGHSRVHPTGHDLNRLFPGLQAGGPAVRHVHGIWTDLQRRNLDLVIDLHSDSAISIPYAIVDRALRSGKGAGLSSHLYALAAATGLTVLAEYPDEQYVRYSLDRSLAGALVNRANTAALTIEAGPRRWVDPEAVRVMVGAVFGVLRALGMVEGGPESPTLAADGGPWRRAASPRNRVTGLFSNGLAPGTRFSRGDVLGWFTDLQGAHREQLTADCEGVVISWAETAWLVAGSAAGTIGVEDEGA